MKNRELLAQTAKIVSSWTAANPASSEDLLTALQVVHRTLRVLASGQLTAVESEPPRPAVPIKNSVRPDYIVCLEDGRKFKMLKRHLTAAYAMTPDEYRAKWGLPRDYPMVAPNYAASRAELAKKIGLGQRRKPPQDSLAKPARGKRGRRNKTAA